MQYTLPAYIGLFAIIPVTLWAFSSRSPLQATLLIAFGSAMFMPEHVHVKLPGIPPIDKETLPYLCLLAAIMVKASARVRQAQWMRGIDLLLVVAFLSGFATALTNPDLVVAGNWRKVYMPGLTITDGLAMGLGDLMTMGAPFLVGRAMFRNRDDMYKLMTFLVSAGLLYSIFCWIEIRLSPQIHRWVYGYSPHNDFMQTMRWGGYRPMVFMYHGLAVAIFMFMTTAIAWVLVGGGVKKLWRWSAKRVAFYLTVVMVLCKSTGAIAYLMFTGLLLRTTPRARLRVAAVVGFIAIAYPTLRANNLIPVESLLEWSNSTFGPERTQSMEFRMRNEEEVLGHSAERALFGWGEFGRNVLYREDGNVANVLDGHWIIRYSTRGAVGFYAAFLLLTIPIFQAARRLRKIPGARDQHVFSGLVLTYSIVVFDLLPNGLYSNYTYMLAGALAGLTAGMTSPAAWATARREAEEEDQEHEPKRRRPIPRELVEFLVSEIEGDYPEPDYPEGVDYRGTMRAKKRSAGSAYKTVVGYAHAPANPQPSSETEGQASSDADGRPTEPDARRTQGAGGDEEREAPHREPGSRDAYRTGQDSGTALDAYQDEASDRDSIPTRRNTLSGKRRKKRKRKR